MGLLLQLPGFLVGRIQWDNWALLHAIVMPAIVSIEISEVVLALHLNHGQAKDSHKRPGTNHNKELAKRLPHPWVKVRACVKALFKLEQFTNVYYPGTIWLGRLDETDYNLQASVVPRVKAAYWPRDIKEVRNKTSQQRSRCCCLAGSSTTFFLPTLRICSERPIFGASAVQAS